MSETVPMKCARILCQLSAVLAILAAATGCQRPAMQIRHSPATKVQSVDLWVHTSVVEMGFVFSYPSSWTYSLKTAPDADETNKGELIRIANVSDPMSSTDWSLRVRVTVVSFRHARVRTLEQYIEIVKERFGAQLSDIKVDYDPNATIDSERAVSLTARTERGEASQTLYMLVCKHNGKFYEVTSAVPTNNVAEYGPITTQIIQRIKFMR